MSDRRRALFFVNRFAIANPTGVQRYALELARAIVDLESEFDLEMCSVHDGTATPPTDIPACEIAWPRRTTQLAWSLLHRPSIERAAGPADLLHLSSPYFPVPSVARAVLTIHDLFPFEHPEWYPRSERVLFGKSLRYHLSEEAQVIVPSNWVAQRVESALGVPRERITVVYEGIASRFTGPVDEGVADEVCARYELGGTPFFVALGGIAPRKNLGVIVEALAMLSAYKALPRLVVIGGDGPFAEQAYASVRDSSAADRVVFAGRLPDEEVRALMSRATAHLHPSLAEGFGLTTLEAMASGTPCIASAAGALPEVVGDAGRLVDPLDPAAWAAAMTELIDDPALRDRLRRLGARRAELFTWRQAAEQTVEVYRKAVAQHR